MIQITNEYNVKQFSHISGSKNTGPNRVSRLPVEFNENELYLNIKKYTFKDIFLLDLSNISKE